ncbi:UDP-N-acetylmuramoyl-L-alanine--D-glutamate ligase [Caviibacter abscessus]|uniref:UDP-N-acetylmuramoyl-L-alanine--D-glutamate ligase n=1 Tax=Caviibacter abscessus TaxID=1766719 RepID=UPI000836A714|nr:UDP-N-acetylmuramoyl-L-alanine--D-glutamate ligase [Caviibacter abscessus]
MKYIVFGLGISGEGAKELLEYKKEEFVVVDDKQGIPSINAIEITNKDDIVIKSPGISWNNEYLKRCLEKGIKIISEIDLAIKYVNPKTKLIAITGTNGKTTTCTKIYELLKYAGYNVALGGNEGHSFAKIITDKNDYDYIVLELSSYQLENNPSIKPYICAITNLTPDHLLRYDSVNDYYITKMNIFKNQDENDYIVINPKDEEFKKLFKDCKSKKIYIEEDENYLVFEGERIIQKEKTSLKGEHNIQNMNFIIAVAKIVGVDTKIIEQFLSSTKSLEHRMEVFFKKDMTFFINDSKGTNVESSLFALDAYKNKNLVLICGGQDKKIDNTKMYEKIYECVDFCLLIGENANQYISEFAKSGYNLYYNAKTLENAVTYISKNMDLKKETYVLLSPATASFDQFKSFEHRGAEFKRLVVEIIGDKNE